MDDFEKLREAIEKDLFQPNTPEDLKDRPGYKRHAASARQWDNRWAAIQRLEDPEQYDALRQEGQQALAKWERTGKQTLQGFVVINPGTLYFPGSHNPKLVPGALVSVYRQDAAIVFPNEEIARKVAKEYKGSVVYPVTVLGSSVKKYRGDEPTLSNKQHYLGQTHVGYVPYGRARTLVMGEQPI